jgi:putative spermidine/putrescine transport system substrate-binding protein
MWGPNVLMYNTKVFPEAPTSWNVVFEPVDLPDGKPNAGRVQAYDGPIHVADAALYLMHNKPELGIQNPYELNEDQYKAALDLLRQQRKLVSRYWHDAFIQMDDFKNEGVVASGSWPFQVNILASEGQPVASTIPVEGATGWADTTMMHADAAHPNCSYMWMEHTLSSNLQSDLSAWFGAVPSVPAACTDGRGMQTAEGCATNGLGDFEKIRFWTTPVSQCASQGECVPYYRWVSDYIGVIGGR